MLQLLEVITASCKPTIRPLFNTKQFQDALLTWTDNTVVYYDFLKSFLLLL